MNRDRVPWLVNVQREGLANAAKSSVAGWVSDQYISTIFLARIFFYFSFDRVHGLHSAHLSNDFARYTPTA